MRADSMQKVGIHGVPRSGTSWLGEIVNSSPNVSYKFQPLFSYEFKDYLQLDSTKNEVDEFFRAIHADRLSDFINRKSDRDKKLLPVFPKDKITHIVYKEVRYHHLVRHLLNVHRGLQIVGIIRNPIDVINSWYCAPREFRKDLGWNIMEEWEFAEKKNQNRAEEFFGYQKWKEVALEFMTLKQDFPDRFMIVNYNDLVFNTLPIVSELFEFLHIPITSQSKNFCSASTTSHQEGTYTVFKEMHKNSNKRRLPLAIVEAIRKDLEGSAELLEFAES